MPLVKIRFKHEILKSQGIVSKNILIKGDATDFNDVARIISERLYVKVKCMGGSHLSIKGNSDHQILVGAVLTRLGMSADEEFNSDEEIKIGFKDNDILDFYMLRC